MEIKEYTIFKKSKLLHLKFTPPHKGKSSFNDELRIVFIIKGSSIYHTPNGVTKLNSGDLIIFNNENFINNWETKTNECEVLIFRISPELLNEIYKSDNIKPFVAENQLSYIVFSLKMINHFFEGFKKYLDESDYLTEELLMIKLRELIFILSKNKEFIIFMDKIDFSNNNTLFRNTISNNLYNPINAEELSFLCNMSLSTFQRKFKEVYNTTPTKYIENQKIKKAKLLLLESKNTISDICHQVGYTSLSHFSKVFKKNCAISPNTFRKSNTLYREKTN